ncbi:DUF3592 domain-containing protein [Corynebacterium suedekumii]|uniref:DUF3592 domain-containing protein n=1 Tax=Corynebacterium suedekumii TaxID=3049801 RepID=A0ABY8VQM7_9CORY|nr:DUF3592 domain-containing protein [Corynebacterium suedekumii]WIM71377.1 DUF3592 domain-containing protein [Corynebacterium suedekumii]
MDFSDWLPLALGGAVVVIGLVATGVGVSLLARPRATGRIIRVEDRRTSRHQPARWIITYEFTDPDGVTHRGHQHGPRYGAREGDPVTVYHRRMDPADRPAIHPWSLVGVGLTVIAAAVVGMWLTAGGQP